MRLGTNGQGDRLDALVRRLCRYLDLTPGERAALTDAQARERRLKAGTTLVEENELSDTLIVVQQGWMHSSTLLANGERQILGFHFAGDLAGTSSIAWQRAATSLTTVSDCVVSDLPKAALGTLFARHPRLGGLLYGVAAAEAVAMSDRLSSIGRMGARDRITMLLLDILARLRATAGGVVDAFDLPLTQRDIGDATGMTKVHANRVLRAMEEDRQIERVGRRVRILEEAALARTIGFVDRYHEVATDWLPAPAAA